ncbi:MAG TPA: hypothetical protein VG406_15020, partial [Isosphaeraceae bacterium]|nr:hypothetical protein [Isosphaeraceae bacterium]
MENAATDFGEVWMQLPDGQALVWAQLPDGQALGAILDEESGCLFYRRDPDDVGFTSRNPKYSGPPDARHAYILSDFRQASYLASWALPVEDISRAIAFFRLVKRPPTFVSWHNDSGDGVVIVPGVRPRMRRGVSPGHLSGTARFLAALWTFACGTAGAFLERFTHELHTGR